MILVIFYFAYEAPQLFEFLPYIVEDCGQTVFVVARDFPFQFRLLNSLEDFGEQLKLGTQPRS